MIALIARVAHLKCMVLSASVNGDSPACTRTHGTTVTISSTEPT